MENVYHYAGHNGQYRSLIIIINISIDYLVPWTCSLYLLCNACVCINAHKM